MKVHIVSDGPERLRQCEEVRESLGQLRESIRSRYAPEFSRAGIVRRFWLRWRMTLEYQRERQHIVPSPHSLYAWHTKTGVSEGQEDL
jgi:hypothetical protein